MIDYNAVILIACMALFTLLIRVLPFFIFSKMETPKAVRYLGNYLPYSIIGMLIIYCIKDMSLIKAPHGAPELISIGVTAVLHILKRNTLLSIIAGTICYMLLIQFIF